MMVRGFIWSNKAWYANAIHSREPEISIGMYDEADGGTSGEFTVKWIDLKQKLAPRMEIFDELAKYDNKAISDSELVDILHSIGFKDLTPYKNPYESTTVPELDNLLTDLHNCNRPIIVRGKAYDGNNPFVINKINNLLLAGKLKICEIKVDDDTVKIINNKYLMNKHLETVSSEIDAEYRLARDAAKQ